MRNLRVIISSAILSVCFAHSSHSQDRQSILKFSNDVELCFTGELKKSAEIGEISPYSGAFVSNRIIEYLSKNTPALDYESAINYCKTQLVPQYLKADKLARSAKPSIFPETAKLTEPIKIDDNFAQITANWIMNHAVVGHPQLTRMALNGLSSGVTFSNDAEILIISASQAPDLYRWRDDRFHAITCIHPDINQKSCAEIDSAPTADRKTVIADSQFLFVDLIDTIMDKVVTETEAGLYESALFWIGSACHSLEDLAFHKGMTSQQHSGLSYVLKKDPDIPKGSKGLEKIEDATNYCRKFIDLVISRSPNNMDKLLNWKSNPNIKLADIASLEFGTGTDMNTTSLIEYWLLSRAYVNDKNKQKELLPTVGGLYVWDTSDIMSKIETKLSSGQ